jgi:hypothetical protein
MAKAPCIEVGENEDVRLLTRAFVPFFGPFSAHGGTISLA